MVRRHRPTDVLGLGVVRILVLIECPAELAVVLLSAVRLEERVSDVDPLRHCPPLSSGAPVNVGHDPRASLTDGSFTSVSTAFCWPSVPTTCLPTVARPWCWRVVRSATDVRRVGNDDPLHGLGESAARHGFTDAVHHNEAVLFVTPRVRCTS